MTRMCMMQRIPRRGTSIGRICLAKLFAQGWDAFWLDSAEPEEYWPHMGDGILREQTTRYREWSTIYTNIFPTHAHTGRARSLASKNRSEKRVSADSLGFLGPTARGCHGLVRRCLQHLLGPDHQVPAGLNFALVRLFVLDHRHWWILAARGEHSRRSQNTRSFTHAGLSTALLPDLPYPRTPTA